LTGPALAAQRLIHCAALGLALGLWYGFLRPLQRGRAVLADTLFMLGAGWAWLFAGFALCGGDLRLGYFCAVGAGAWAFDRTLGKLLMPVIFKIWWVFGKIFLFFVAPGKIFLKKVKILFASAKKWVTIKWNNRPRGRTSGGKTHGKDSKPLQQRADRIPPQQTSDQDRGLRRYRVVYGGTDHSAPCARPYPGSDRSDA
jgi:hypothetical protein